MTTSKTTGSNDKTGTGISPPSADEKVIVKAVQADPQHDLEIEAVELSTFFLNSAVAGADGWAWSRIPVWADFFVGHDRLFRFALEDAKLGPSGKVNGRLRLHYNIGFLIQNPACYLESIVPECIARAIDQISRFSKGPGSTQAPAGDGQIPGWAIWHKKISGRDPLTLDATKRQFNKLPAQLLDGHALGECQCEGARARLHALDAVKLQKVGQMSLRCETCGEPIVRLADSRRPGWIVDELTYLASRARPAPRGA